MSFFTCGVLRIEPANCGARFPQVPAEFDLVCLLAAEFSALIRGALRNRGCGASGSPCADKRCTSRGSSRARSDSAKTCGLITVNISLSPKSASVYIFILTINWSDVDMDENETRLLPEFDSSRVRGYSRCIVDY